MKKLQLKKSIFIPILCFCVLLLLFLLCRFLTLPVSSAQKKSVQIVEVPSGSSLKAVTEQLGQKKLIRSKSVFYFCARYPIVKWLLTGDASSFMLKSGGYEISSDMNVSRICSILSEGRQIFKKVSIPEGYSLSKIAERLESSGVCKSKDFMEASKNLSLVAKYKIPAESFEGYLFPDTYFFTAGMSGDSVVTLMADTFFAKVASFEGLSGKTPLELHKIVTLASIVEREYRRAEEAPLIASVFSNRLKRNIGLYSCATIEYIITEIQGLPHPDVITYADLAIDSPYNTYKWAGLPPGPISNPGMTALSAAVNPANTNYYFFRLTDAATGKHVFSTDFSSHVNEGYISATKKTGN